MTTEVEEQISISEIDDMTNKVFKIFRIISLRGEKVTLRELMRKVEKADERTAAQIWICLDLLKLLGAIEESEDGTFLEVPERVDDDIREEL